MRDKELNCRFPDFLHVKDVYFKEQCILSLNSVLPNSFVKKCIYFY